MVITINYFQEELVVIVERDQKSSYVIVHGIGHYLNDVYTNKESKNEYENLWW